MKYSVVIFPSSNVQDVANSYRKRYDPAYPTIPPYIRLRETFELDEAKLPELVNHLNHVADTTDAFSIHFNRVSTFFPANNVIYLATDNKQPLEALHDKIGEYFAGQSETYAYVPHLTIGRDLSDDELKDVLGQLRMQHFDLTSPIDRFHLIYQLEDGVWSVYQTFQLRK